MNQSKEQPIKSKEEIYKEAWAKWANETFITDPPLKKEDCDNEHSWIYGAMEDYAKQFIQSGIKGWVKASDPPKEKGRYFVRAKLYYYGKVVNACVEWNKFWHIQKRDEVIEWLDETQTPIHSGEERWISVDDRLPDLSIEYNVAWDLEDGYEELVTTTMEFDVKNKKWIDVINGGFDVTKNVKYWQPLPKPPNSLLSSEQNVQECDASKADQGGDAGKQKK